MNYVSFRNCIKPLRKDHLTPDIPFSRTETLSVFVACGMIYL